MSSPYSMPLQFPFAANLFGLKNGLSGYLIPKPKFLFYVQFKMSQQYSLPQFENNRLGYLVKHVDRPKLQYTTQTLDQYNRKRVAYTKVDYPAVGITLHDTVDGAAAKMIDDYNRFHFGDFSNMLPNDNSDTHNALWANNSIDGNDMTYWGYRLKNPLNELYSSGPTNRNFPTNDYFFDEINIYEFYGQKFTMYSLMNPKIESVNFDATDSASADAQEISITVNPEGVLFRYIDAPLEYSTLAPLILPGPGFSTRNFPIADMDFNDFVQGLVGQVGGGLLNNLTDGLYGTFGTSLMGNLGYLGSTAATIASTGALGSAAASLASPQNLFFAQDFASTAALQSNTILGGNILKAIGTVSGTGTGAVTLAKTGGDSNGAIKSVNVAINSLF
jgi:hypothetical protein